MERVKQMRTIWREIKYWSQIFLIPLYGISYIFPRNKRIWVFGSTFGRRFADNPKYLYLYVNQYKADHIRPIWISKKKEIVRFLQENQLESYYLYSLKGVWYSLRAKVYLYDNYSKDICYPLSGGAKRINLWHGIPLKKIQKDNRFDFFRNPRTLGEKLYGIPRRISDEKSSDYVVSPSDYFKGLYSSAFRTERVIVNEYPRKDILLSDSIKDILLLGELAELEKLKSFKENYKLVLYMPTFRDSEDRLFDVIDFNQFQRFLEENEIMFCIKLHPKSKIYGRLSQNRYLNIMALDPQSDSYSFLKIADVLVTDYSSIYFDYLYIRRPIIFFSYDLDEYLLNSREMYFDYKDFTPGIKVCTMEELEQELLHPDLYQEPRDKCIDKIYGKQDDTASESLYHRIAEELQLDE